MGIQQVVNTWLFAKHFIVTMMNGRHKTRHKTHGILARSLSLSLRVIQGFKRNQGLLLSGAVAYYTLLSIVPMSILALIGLSHFIEEDQLFQTLSPYLEMIIPGYAATLTDQVKVFIAHRKVFGTVGFLVIFFFSSIAFTVL